MTLPQPNEISLPQDIRNAAIRGQLTFFIGNGVSRLFGIPSWDELADKMLNKLVEHGKLDCNQREILLKRPTKLKISIADYYFKKNIKTKEIKELSYASVLMKDIKKDEVHKKTPAYQLISEFKAKLITTNYDWLLSDVLLTPKTNEPTIEEFKVKNAKKPQDPALNTIGISKKSSYKIYKNLDEFGESSLASNNFLVHLHGSLSDEKNLIVSTADYLKLYGDKINQRKLKSLFDDQTVVFIGYGLEELEILDLILRSSKMPEKTHDKPRFFIIFPLFSHETEILDQLREYYKQLNIELIEYCRDKNNALIDVLERWAGKIKDIIQEPSLSDQHRLLDKLSHDFLEPEDGR